MEWDTEDGTGTSFFCLCDSYTNIGYPQVRVFQAGDSMSNVSKCPEEIFYFYFLFFWGGILETEKHFQDKDVTLSGKATMACGSVNVKRRAVLKL